MRVRSLCLAALLAVAGCSGDEETAQSGDHFAKDQKAAMDKAAEVGDTLRQAAEEQKKKLE